MPVKNGQYIDVQVGQNPGRDSVILRLSWAVNGAVIYVPPMPTTYSNTFSLSASDSTRGTERVQIAQQSFVRFPVRYAMAGDLGEQDSDDTSDRVTHHGVFGLSRNSTLRRYWTRVTWSWSDLWLGTPPDFRWALEFLQDRDKVRACIDDRCFWIRISLDLDHSYMADDLYAWWTKRYGGNWIASSKKKPGIAMLKVFVVQHTDPCRIYFSPECRARRAMRWNSADGFETLALALDSTALDNNDNSYETVRKMRLVNQTAAMVSPQDEDQAEMWLGREHLHGVIISHDAVMDRVSMASLPLSMGESEQYLWLLVGCVIFIVLWFPGVYENIHRVKYSEFTHTKPQQMTSFGYANVIRTLRESTRISAIALFLALHYSLKSYRVIELLPYFIQQVSSRALYWILVALSLGLVNSLPLIFYLRNPQAYTFAQTIMFFTFAWLISVVKFHSFWLILAMLVFSWLIFRLFTWQMIEELFVQFPKYRPLLPKIFMDAWFGGGSSPVTEVDHHGGRTWFAWAVLFVPLFVLWVCVAWFFAFYNVGIYIEQRYPTMKPAQVIIGLFVLGAVFCLSCLMPFLEERLTMLSAIINLTSKAMSTGAKDTPAPARAGGAPQGTSAPLPQAGLTDLLSSTSPQTAPYSSAY